MAQSKIIKLALSKQMDQEKLEQTTKKQIQIEQERIDADLIKAKYFEDKDANAQ